MSPKTVHSNSYAMGILSGWLILIVGFLILTGAGTCNNKIETALGIDENGVVVPVEKVPNMFTAEPDVGCYAVKEDGYDWTNAVGTSYESGREFAPYFWCHMMGTGQDSWETESEVVVWQQSRYDLTTAPQRINVYAIESWRPVHFVHTEARPYLEAKCAEFDAVLWGISGLVREPDDYWRLDPDIWCVRSDGELGYITPTNLWVHFADNFVPFQ